MTITPQLKTKLYVIVRADLPPGDQIAQAVHATIEFYTKRYALPGGARGLHTWHECSNTVAVLAVRSESALFALLDKAHRDGVSFDVFREPDRGGELTAAVLEPTEDAERICAGLPLALEGATRHT